MIVALLSGILVSIFQIFFGKALKRYSVVYTILPAALFGYFLSFVNLLPTQQQLLFTYNWLPSAGIHLAFRLDGLALVFALMITGIGTLVFLYASAYMKGDKYTDRFFGYLSLFMAAMLGVVLSDNVIALFMFWELTSISSFFLIGYKNEDEGSRKSALTALYITGGGGLLLFAGLILLSMATGTYSIMEMISSRELVRDYHGFGWILFFLLAGAFTKSAQFPFHFWLPAAMKAPTPVSAYLHSATMVKAGVYLAARFTPLFNGSTYWNNTLMIVGGVTMLYTAFHSIFRTDLKAILAYSTVSALGILFFLLGVGTQGAFIAAAVFLLVHAFYKAGLFLTAGIIDHETGMRDVTKLGGLRRVLVPVAIAGLFAALSNAGIPLTFGFLGKDLVYEATLHSNYGGVLTAVAILVNIFLLYAGFNAGIRPFAGKMKPEFERVHLPPVAMWLPPLILGVGGILFGLLPGLIDKALIQPVVLSLSGIAVDISLKLWHGFNLILLLSFITLTAGTLLYFFHKPAAQKLAALERWNTISPPVLFTKTTAGVKSVARGFTDLLQNGYLRFYLFTIVSFLVLVLFYRFVTRIEDYQFNLTFGKLTFYEIGVFVLIIIAILITISTPSRLTAVAALGVVGLCLCLFFVFYSAPDLAMTQFTIDTLTVVLFVLVLFKLPPFLQYSNTTAKLRDAALSLLAGFFISMIALDVLNQKVTKDISAYYAENSYHLAKGKNVVNVILVDFRGADTLIEITVLTIAAIGVFSLLKLKVNPLEKE